MPLQDPAIYIAQLEALNGVVSPLPMPAEFYASIITVVHQMLSDATVVTNPAAPLTAPTGGGPVTGTGIIT